VCPSDCGSVCGHLIMVAVSGQVEAMYIAIL